MSNPNQEAARALFEAGFFPFRLPANEKKPPQVGYTGRKTVRPPDEQILADIAQIPADANIGASLPVGVIGIDIDTYDGKAGGSHITALEQFLGPLPPTYFSTRRGPQNPTGPTRSGQYLYQAPNWAIPEPSEPPRFRDIPPAVEIIHYGHRYMATAPSTVDGLTYQWYRPDGEAVSGPPDVTLLPVLPDAWTEHLLA